MSMGESLHLNSKNGDFVSDNVEDILRAKYGPHEVSTLNNVTAKVWYISLLSEARSGS